MAERPPLAPRLRELDETLAERGMPPGARSRVAARLRQESLRREATAGFRFRWLPALTFAAGAALVLLVVGLRLGGEPGAPQVAHATPSVFGGAFAVQGEGCRHREHGSEVELDGTCRLVAPHLSVHTWSRVHLRDGDHDRDVRLLQGTAMFDVTTVEPGASPTRIHVSHGVIEVLGTRFTIEQGPHGGHVDLFEGRIRFIDREGVVTEIAPGQRHAWGSAVAALSTTPPGDEESAEIHEASARSVDEAADGKTSLEDLARAADHAADHAADTAATQLPAPPTAERRTSRGESRRGPRDRNPSDAEPQAEPALGSTDEVTAIIDEVTRLRAQGRYAEAADVLRRAARTRRWDARTAQVLSYELGEIIERHLGDREAACTHWTHHAERWSGGRYARAVRDAQARLHCPAATTPTAPP